MLGIGVKETSMLGLGVEDTTMLISVSRTRAYWARCRGHEHVGFGVENVHLIQNQKKETTLSIVAGGNIHQSLSLTRLLITTPT